MPAPKQDWLDLTSEDALDPDLPICDPHHHLWVHPENPYMLDDLMADTSGGHNVVSTVFVECTSGYYSQGAEAMRPVGETHFVEAVAEQSASASRGRTVAAAGIVSFADLTLGDAVEPVLEAHMSASKRFRGIRHACGWDASPDIRDSHTHPPAELYLDRTFRTGFARLAELDLSFDAWLYHPQIPELTSLARAFPKARIVLDHVGGPLGIGPYAGKQSEVLAQWRNSIAALAKCENVYVKLGGLVMPINGFGWHKHSRPPTSTELAEALKPYVMYCIEQFGPDRCMFESNFPVDKVSCSYTVLWNTFKRLSSECTKTERSWLFLDAATTFYRL